MSRELQPEMESAIDVSLPSDAIADLAADGYALEVSRTDSVGLVGETVAGPDAREERLIPKEMFAGMLSSRLSSEGMEFSDLTPVYPAD